MPSLVTNYLLDAALQQADRVFLMRVSYLEIYNETVTDLLTKRSNLQIREEFSKGGLNGPEVSLLRTEWLTPPIHL